MHQFTSVSQLTRFQALISGGNPERAQNHILNKTIRVGVASPDHCSLITDHCSLITVRSLSVSFVVHEQLRKLLLQRLDLRPIAHQYVGIVRIVQRVILVIILSAIKRHERSHLGHDRLGKNLRRIELRNVGLRNALLFVVRVENDRPI